MIEGVVVENFNFIRNRLTAMTNFAPGSTVISTYAYTLDGVGNRTRVDLNEPMMPSYNAETVNYTYSLGNILNTVDGNTYTHDANGNRTQKSGNGGTTTYTYDSLNRLVQTVKGSQTTQYIYNGLGQRVGRVDNGVQTNYLIDPNNILPQVLAETDNTGNLISFYVYDGAGLVAKVTPQNQYYFYHFDGLGSTIAITDSAGQVVNSYCYSPEGLVGVQETIPSPFTYVGRFGVMAEGNGLYFMRGRYYDPEVGRFINKDPIGYAGGLNLYGYVGNNPIRFTDPAGLQALIGYQIRRIDGTTNMYFYDQVFGTEYVFKGLKENAPIISKKTNYAYGKNSKLPPFQWYYFVPRPDPKAETIIKKGWPVYTTPGQEIGIVIDPHGGVRTWIGPHPPKSESTISSGCPLFPFGEEGELEHEMLAWLIQYYAEIGGTMIYVWEE